jgi:hypothetical protein
VHDDITKASWRKASYCNGATACVEVAPLPDGGVALRDSKDPGGPPLWRESMPGSSISHGCTRFR